MPASEDAPRDGDTAIRKRSVTLAGHRTSVSVENAFWTHLKAIAVERDIAVAQILTEIDSARRGNLSSAVRLYVLDWLTKKAANRAP